MYLVIKNHSYTYNVQTATQIFFQNETFVAKDEVQLDGYSLVSEKFEDFFETRLYKDGSLLTKLNKKIDTDISHEAKLSVFLLLRDFLGYEPVYGVLSGIRPTKLVQKLSSENKSEEEIRQILKNRYFVDEEKIEFLLKVSNKELEVLDKIDIRNNALYIGIPFCPSICAYCSFTSFNMKKYKDNGIMSQYVDYLIEELTYVVTNSKNKIENLYIGGGTPTSLDDGNFEKLLKSVNEVLDVNELKEFTVEAGRVDTITETNMLLMKKYGVSRISINAQTMKNETLRLNGRTHTKEDFIEKFNLARRLGFDFINVDIIVGLLGEEKEDIVNSLNEILELKPENITIHTLAIKKGAVYKQNIEQFDFMDNKKIKETLDLLYGILYKLQYLPYYMYRQKNILGNFENTGFALSGYESLYNVSIILEVQSIIGLGSGSASKLVLDDKVTREYNFKGVEEYIEKFDTILERKSLFF